MSKDAMQIDRPLKRSKKRYCPKTKTGCLTCRIRRVKCDEAKPDCLKCTKTGRTCDGYVENIPSRSTASNASPQRSLTPDSCSNALERRIFEWFRHQTVPILCGHFPDETYSRTTLQLYFSEPAVRYTVNAFGALHHELYSIRQARNAGLTLNLRTYFPAQRYAMALQEMQILLSKEDVPLQVVLVCSVLLVQFEGLQQDFVPAMQHAEKALGLLSAGHKKIDTSLLRTMMRFDAQSAMHAGRKAPQLASYASDLDRQLPPALTSAVEARYLVTSWASRLYAFSQSIADRYILEPGAVPLEASVQAQELEQVFCRLIQLLAAFRRKQGSKLPVREKHGLQVLSARLKILRIFSATCLYSEATLFDAYFDDFQDILETCTDLLNDDRADRRLFVLHIDEGLMHPLYLVATYCRDSRIRHRAFDLLRELPVGNGFRIWHADVVIRTAKLIIDYEQAGLEDLKCSDVPEWRRVHHASFDNWDVESWHTTFGGPLRVRPNGLDGEWMHLHEALDYESLRSTGNMPLLYAPLNEGVPS